MAPSSVSRAGTGLTGPSTVSPSAGRAGTGPRGAAPSSSCATPAGGEVPRFPLAPAATSAPRE
eukprot:1139648-Pyramimonas_sp.AAC.1